jgi:beta-lactamase superfamily II metal-dependent hydrolase
MALHVLGEDLVRIREPQYSADGSKVIGVGPVIIVRYWGDELEVTDGPAGEGALADEGAGFVEVRIPNPFDSAGKRAAIQKRRADGKFVPLRLRDDAGKTLAVTFIDVQQGDATLIRTPRGRTILVDGGEDSFVARVLAATFPHTTAAAPFVIDALIVTHGDADHYTGLFELDQARHFGDDRVHQRIHARVDRYFHNGLVKTGADGSQAFGTRIVQPVAGPDAYWITALWDDPRDAPTQTPSFQNWGTRLTSLLAAGVARPSPVPGEALPLVRRLGYGDDDAFELFRDEGISLRVLGPHTESIQGETALPFLRHEGALSASHTINGHSVILKLQLGTVSLMLGGDLNQEGGARLLERLAADPAAPPLRSEVLKVPHHGSGEFSAEFLSRVSPVVSVVSSGDENEAKEYIHPRANLMGALGRHSRPDAPALVFSTELAAFFRAEGFMLPAVVEGSTLRVPLNQQPFFAFRRINFGRIHLRTDGRRVVVASESAVDGIKEAYAFTVDAAGAVTTDAVAML